MLRTAVAVAAGMACVRGAVADPAASVAVAAPSPLAAGEAWSLTLGAGGSLSRFIQSAVASETGAFGEYISSSRRSALSVELVETLNVVADRTTPQYGLVGAGLHYVGRTAMFGPCTIDFARLVVGVAGASGGMGLETGLGAAVELGYLPDGRDGFTVQLGSYWFGASNIRDNTLFAFTIGYVYDPVGYHPHRAHRSPERPAACDAEAPDRSELEQADAARVAACTDAASSACAQAREASRAAAVKLNICLAGRHAL
jgi:hypothetical protein